MFRNYDDSPKQSEKLTRRLHSPCSDESKSVSDQKALLPADKFKACLKTANYIPKIVKEITGPKFFLNVVNFNGKVLGSSISIIASNDGFHADLDNSSGLKKYSWGDNTIHILNADKEFYILKVNGSYASFTILFQIENFNPKIALQQFNEFLFYFTKSNNPIKPAEAAIQVYKEPKSKEKAYCDAMQEARKNLQITLKRMEHEESIFLTISPDDLKKFRNLYLTKNEGAISLYPCFDDLWEKIQSVFDKVRDAKNDNEAELYKKDFKEIVRLLTSAGIPYVNGKQLTFWSTQFARDEAVRFSKEHKAVTDGIAQEYLRKIFLGYPDGAPNVFFHMIKSNDPDYPELYRFVWGAMSEDYAEQLQPGDIVHVFFQDSITAGNFFWNVELQAIRKQNANIILHQYDLQTLDWNQQFHIDSVKGLQIPVRRRNIHPMDELDQPLSEDKFIVDKNDKIWKQEYREDKRTNELVSWTAPKILTMDKLKQMTNKMKISSLKKAKNSKFFSEQSSPDPIQIKTPSTSTIKNNRRA